MGHRVPSIDMKRTIDLRSDTVTLPTKRMLDAMHGAVLGDDGLDGDPTVRRLEALACTMLGKEAALLVASGTMGNLIAALVHSRRGGEALVDEDAHIARSEAGGVSHLAGLMCTRMRAHAGEMVLDEVQAAIRPCFTTHAQPTAMVVVETSHNHSGGRVPSIAYMAALQKLARTADVPVHMDGARIFNAALALQTDVASIAGFSDSVTFCLSKGLSAPMGAVLLGTRDFISQARTFRRMVGGGWRQGGCIAAAGVVALEDMPHRLTSDHNRAYTLWRNLHSTSTGLVDARPPQTNMVVVEVQKNRKHDVATAVDKLKRRGLLVRSRDQSSLRLVTHRHISDDDIAAATEIVLDCLAQ